MCVGARDRLQLGESAVLLFGRMNSSLPARSRVLARIDGMGEPPARAASASLPMNFAWQFSGMTAEAMCRIDEVERALEA